ncbi:hypothetical protein D3OALGA1CA_2258 [Olavius algarvensis associated proteobacterium Delta 3]|nr:hypothetical protein D3OALGA1CA_2258 [Olavius algarvensis associated proteobacterium Delta 3]CAB5165565.1 hypothetical protein D3OALGB2SA_5727 [Olavius algarvensis associated proteobacterium Delta 3]
MGDDQFEELLPAQLEQYRQTHHEKGYLLIDVREPDEYAQNHIPGARLMPIAELVRSMDGLPDNRDLIFYCRSGPRSMAAAAMVLDEEISSGKIYNLAGGILNWHGRLADDYPKVQVFSAGAKLHDLLYTAMDLEKGAQQFYTAVRDQTADANQRETFDTLSRAEIGHARMIYTFWEKTEEKPPVFDTLFAALNGEILEGGTALVDAFQRIAVIPQPGCIPLIELALDIEYAAYDLYRAMADNSEAEEIREAFLSLAQAEKKHMRVLIDAVAGCRD